MPKNLRRSLLVLSICSLLVGAGWAADDKDQSDIAKRLDASSKVLEEVMGTPDKAIPDKVMSGAKCIAVIPSMVKIAVGFGGNHGKGSSDLPNRRRGGARRTRSLYLAEAGYCNWAARRSTSSWL